MNSAIRPALFFLAILFSLPATAQLESNRIIKKYSIREGLSQAVVNSIAQDNKGLMWFATDDGLNRFDGYAFTTFKYDRLRKGYHDNFVQSTYKDADGTLWVSSRKGFYQFDLSTQQLTPYLDAAAPAVSDVSYITAGSTGNLWIGLYWGGFAFFDKKTDSVAIYDQQSLPSLTSTATICVYEDSYGLLWVGSQDKGLNVFRIKNSAIHERLGALSDPANLPSLYVKCFEEDHLGNIWIGTTKGLVLYMRRENKFHVFRQPDTGIESRGIFSLLQDSDKKLWIGTQGGGLHTLNLKDFDGRQVEKLSFYHVEVLDQYNISRHTIRSVFEDKDKNIWIGTHGDGIYMLGSEEKKFTRFQVKKFVRSAESFVSYYGLCNDEDGFIWAGSDGGGIYKISRTGEIVKQYTADGKPGSITDNVVISAFRDHEDNLWFGTYSHGLFLYDKTNDTFIHFKHVPSDSPVPLGNQVRLIFEDSKKNIRVGATRGGLCLVDRKEKTYKYHRGNKTLTTIDARTIAEDKAGGLWLGCYGNGLNYFDPETDRCTRYLDGTDGTASGDTLGSNIIYALAFDKKNRLWIGSGGGGLSVYNTVDKSFKRYTEKEGLINNTIYGLQLDDAGQIWASTIKGISKFDPDTEQFFNFTSFDGLQEGQFNPGSSLYNLPGGYMCFGGTLGLNLFYPSDVTNQSKTPEVMISGFQLFNKPVEVSNNSETLLSKVIDETDRITLNHDQSVFTFEFIGLNYSYPEKNKYAFKLEGLDRDWNYVGNQRSATYRYLPAGTYEFKVKATSQDNVWPAEYASIQLVIRPPFWKTPFAYLLYFLTVTFTAYGVISFRKKQDGLRKRLRIEKAQRKRERHMVQEKLSFFTEVSHEFRTPLTLMIGPLEEILMREGVYTPVGRKLKMVYKNAHKLLNLINKLLDYRKVETGNMVLKVSEDNIVSFVEEIFITFREMAIRKNIRFEFYSEQTSIITWFDKEKLEMVLNNIISNSFKYIGKGDAISITVKHKNAEGTHDKAVIQIRDNGIGIPKNQLKYIFDWFYQGNKSSPVSSGIGLALAKKLVYLHKGQLYVESEEGKGAEFTIEIPMGRNHFEPNEIVIDEGNAGILFNADPSLLADAEFTEHSHKKGLKSFLIVEDDPDVRQFLKEFFERDYKIYESDSGSEGLDIAIKHNPDVVISDVMMPQMNGIDLCKQLKGNIKTSHIPVILLTAKTSFSHHKEGLEIGADAYITKPFSPEMLSLTINNLLQSRENLKRFYRNLFITNGSDKNDLASPDGKLLHRVYEFLKSNLDKPEFSLDALCEELAMSRSLLYKKIKMLTGLSPVEYIRSLRLAEAASLLKTGKYKVFEVVYMVGFTDIKYFRQCFVKEFGYPPSQLIE